MKNYLFNAVMLSTMAFVLGACSDDNSGDEQVSQTPIVLMGKAYTFNPEDAGEQWKSGKTVGIYMLKENTVECIEPYCNVKYQTTVMPEGYCDNQHSGWPAHYRESDTRRSLLRFA